MRTPVIRLFFASTLLSIAACSGGGGSGGGEESHELVRMIQANPEFTAIDFDIADQRRFEEVPYGSETGYFDVVEGKITVAVKSDNQVLPIVEEELTIDAGKDYTIFFLDVANVPDLVLIEDDRTPPEEDGQFRLRAGNFAPSRESVDIYIVHPGDRIDDQTPLATAVAYQSFGAYKAIDAGSYQIKYTAAGSSRVIRSTDTIEFQSGGVYSHILIDDAGGGSPQQSRLLIDALY